MFVLLGTRMKHGVSDESCHNWDVVNNVGFRGGGCLYWRLRLGVWQEVEYPKPSACDFSPSAEEHFSSGTKNFD